MYLVFDIGASNTRISLADKKRLLKPMQFASPKNFSVFLKKLSQYAASTKISSIAGGMPGQFDVSSRHFIKARNLPSWREINVAGLLKKKFRCPVALENDVALAGLGEAVFGAGRGKSIVVYYTVSTGINGVRIVDGKIDSKAWGFETGRQLLDGKHDLESLVGGASIRRRYGRLPEEIKERKIWEQVSKDLSRGIFNSMLHWSPHIIILGGGLIEAGAIKAGKVEQEVKRLNNRFDPPEPFVRIVSSKLRQFAGLHGATVLAKNI